jgi:predicted transcriptional regulator
MSMFTIQISSEVMSRLDLLAAKKTGPQKAEARGREFEVEPGNAKGFV